MTAGASGDPDGLERTRDAVMDVLLIDGLGIALSGWALARSGYSVTSFEPYIAQRFAFVPLVILVFASIATRRIWAGRWRLRDPARRAGRLLRAHVASALVGGLAIPLGHVFARDFLPTLRGAGPFWIVALAMGLLALPRDSAVAGLERKPISSADEFGR